MTKQRVQNMFSLTDLILAADKAFEPEDDALKGLSEEQAKNVINNIVPLTFEPVFKKLLKDGEPVINLLNMFDIDDDQLSIEFPYVELNNDKLEITIHFYTEDGLGGTQTDCETFEFTPNEVLAKI